MDGPVGRAHVLTSHVKSIGLVETGEKIGDLDNQLIWHLVTVIMV